MGLDEQIGCKLKSLRKKDGLSTREAGRRIGISHAYISKIEHGQIPSLVILEKLANLYNIKMADLFRKETNSPEKWKCRGEEWFSFALEMEKQNLSPEEIKNYIDIIKKLKSIL